MNASKMSRHQPDGTTHLPEPLEANVLRLLAAVFTIIDPVTWLKAHGYKLPSLPPLCVSQGPLCG